MKCLRLVCLVSLIVTPIFAAASDNSNSWVDLCSLDERTPKPTSSSRHELDERTPKPTSSSKHELDDSDDSDTEVTFPKNDKIATCQLALLNIRTYLEATFNALNGEQPNIDDAIKTWEQYKLLHAAKAPSMSQELQRLKELQDASAQSNGAGNNEADNEK